MSGIKRHLENVQAEEEMNDWIRDQGDMFMVEGDEEWEELKARYLNGDTSSASISVFDDWDDDAFEAELRWTKEQLAFFNFTSQINEIRNNLIAGASDITLKMNYSFAVTIMESCLGDMLRGVIISNNHYLVNSIKNVNELKNIKVTLLEVYEQEDLVIKLILKTLAEKYTYHNINTVIAVYGNVISEPLSEPIKRELEAMNSIVRIRHDIVHRNGFTTDGTEHEMTYAMVMEAIATIMRFVAAIKGYINSAEAKRAFGPVNPGYAGRPL